MRVSFYTLGCKLNFSESSAVSRSFRNRGFHTVPFGEETDVVVINTCTVTSKAEKKCRNIIRKAVKMFPGAYIIVTGCYSQLKSDEIASLPGVDVVLGSGEKSDIFRYIKGFEKKKQPDIFSGDIRSDKFFSPAYSLSGRTRSFLKIQDGCDYFCSYCTIPLARGRSRNAPVADIVEQAKIIAERGVKEIVLTGVNIGDFGKTTGESFIELVDHLDKVEGIERFRISSIEPNLLTDELIMLVAGSRRFAPHFHIPLQSGSDEILAKMNRRYKRDLFEERVSRIFSVIPAAGVGADIITGFPGEDEKKFYDSLYFLERLDLSYIHVFSYSERDGTEASSYGEKVSPEEKVRRSGILHDFSEKKQLDFFRRNYGSQHFVIFEEGSEEEKMTGYTGNYIKVKTNRDPARINRLTRVKLAGISGDGFMSGEIG